MIKPSDKGGNVVVWPTYLYEREALRQLRCSHHYKRLTFNTLFKFRLELSGILDDAIENGIINRQQYDALLPMDPKIATFYMLPKVHKDLRNPPGRPIVSGNGNLCEPICKLIDHVLRPFVETLPSYLKDSSDVLRKMNDIQFDDDMILVTCDVESLYTSIKHCDGLEAVRFS